MGLCLKYFIQPDENNAKPPEPTTATDAVLLFSIVALPAWNAATHTM